MARIAGVDLPRNKRIEIALTYIYGLGRYVLDRYRRMERDADKAVAVSAGDLRRRLKRPDGRRKPVAKD